MSWDQDGQPLVGQHVLCLPAAAHKPEDPIPDLQRPRDIRPQLIDFSHVFESRDVGWNTGGCGIHTATLQEIGAVQPERTHPHPNLLAPRLGSRYVANLEDFRTADAGDNNGFHWSRFSTTRGMPVTTFDLSSPRLLSISGMSSRCSILKTTGSVILDRFEGDVETRAYRSATHISDARYKHAWVAIAPRHEHSEAQSRPKFSADHPCPSLGATGSETED